MTKDEIQEIKNNHFKTIPLSDNAIKQREWIIKLVTEVENYNILIKELCNILKTENKKTIESIGYERYYN